MTKRLSDSKVSSMVIGNYIPDGATATPVDDYTIWLRCAVLPNTYGSLANVIADTTAMETLCNNLNALRYMVRSEDVIMPAVLADSDWVAELDSSAYSTHIPTMTGDTAPSGTIIYQSYDAGEAHTVRKNAFDKDADTGTCTAYGVAGNSAYIGYQFTDAIYPYKVTVLWGIGKVGGYTAPTVKYKLQQSTDGTTWNDISDEQTATSLTTTLQSIELTAFSNTARYRLIGTDSTVWNISGQIWAFIMELDVFGLDLS